MLDELDGDALLISPVANELDIKKLGRLDGYGLRVMDPQGLLRRFDDEGNVYKLFYEEGLEWMRKFNYVKLNIEEMKALLKVGSVTQGLYKILSMGTNLLVTSPKKVYVSSRGRIYVIDVPWKTVEDNTGFGDIFASSFIYMLLREGDPLWAASFSTATVLQCIRGVGIDKTKNIEYKGALRIAEEIYELSRPL